MRISNNKDKKAKFLKIYFKKFIVKLYKPALLLVSFQIIIFIFFALDNRNHIKSKLPVVLKYMALSLDTYEIKDYQEYFKSLLSSLISKNQLERVDISLSFLDKQKLECDRLRKNNCTKDGWARSSMNWNGEEYKIKLKAKGDRKFHRLNLNQMSFKIDIRGSKKFKGMEEFSMQLPVLRNYTLEAMVSKSMRVEDLISPRNHYIKLFINGEYLGIRHLEESFSKELVENNKRRVGPVFSLNENLGPIYKNATFDLHDKKYWRENKSDLPLQALSILRRSRIEEEIFNKYFDLDKWASYMAMLNATELFHGTVPKSVKFFLNPTTGLIEPIFFDGHYVGGLFGEFQLTDFLNKDTKSIRCRWTCPNIYFYQMMFGNSRKVNSEFLILYLKYLKKYSSEEFIKNTFKKYWDELSLARGTIYREGYRRDAISSYGLLPHVGQFNRIKKRLIKIRAQIQQSELLIPEHSFNSEKKYLKLENINSKLPQIYNLYCLNKNISENIVLVKNIAKIINLNEYSECAYNDFQFSINKGEKKYQFEDILMGDLDVENFNNNEKKSYLNKKTLKKFIFKDELIISNDLIKVKKDIYFRPKSRICIEKGKILYIKDSKIFFEGTKENPNIFLGCSKDGGSVIIENSLVNIGVLKTSNLNAPKIKLRTLYGGINIIKSNIEGDQITLENTFSEDAINFIDSKIKLNKLEFNKITSDAIDSDFSELNIKNITCKDIGNDCIDLSFSKGYIGKIDGDNVKDKLISLGESSSLLVSDIKARNSDIGLVSKDNSKLTIENFSYKNIDVPIATYIKKQEFGRPYIKIMNIEPKKYNLMYISDDSEVEIENEKIIGRNKSKNIINLLYGKLYGTKTKR